VTRQQKRAQCRVAAWQKWRCSLDRFGRVDYAPRDDRGVMRRSVRRDIALTIARQAYKRMPK
jgi:hypothetical protein